MPTLQPGQFLDGTNFRVVRRLGAGGMGEVWEVENVRIKKRYCAKTIHERVADDPETFIRFEREAEVLARIKHRNVVEVHDLVTTNDGITFVLMEMLSGINLRKCIRSGTHIERQDILQIAIDVLEALSHVHSHGIIHRDVKPENIFLAEDAMETVTKLLDFGIVHVIQGNNRHLTQGKFIGTLTYAAPEQLRGFPPCPANDIYAVGLVLYEMLAGRGPFHDAGDARAIGLARLDRPAKPLSRIIDVPRELSDLLARVLEREPEKRPPSAGAFASQLYLIRQQLRQVSLATANTTDVTLMTQVQALTEAGSTPLSPLPLAMADTEKPPKDRAPVAITEKLMNDGQPKAHHVDTVPMPNRPTMGEVDRREAITRRSNQLSFTKAEALAIRSEGPKIDAASAIEYVDGEERDDRCSRSATAVVEQDTTAGVTASRYHAVVMPITQRSARRRAVWSSSNRRAVALSALGLIGLSGLVYGASQLSLPRTVNVTPSAVTPSASTSASSVPSVHEDWALTPTVTAVSGPPASVAAPVEASADAISAPADTSASSEEDPPAPTSVPPTAKVVTKPKPATSSSTAPSANHYIRVLD